MRIGVDLDNTIVCYDGVFTLLAVEAGLPDAVSQRGKLQIRDFLRRQDREDEWTVMQGRAYGDRMADAVPFAGALDVLAAAKAGGHGLFVVSHRTKRPYLGEPSDLHASALDWLNKRGVDQLAEVFLEETAESKAQRIHSLACDVFIDDLPEFLRRPDFPASARRLHFCPGGPAEGVEFETVVSWAAVGEMLLGK
jgi:hypothetical protein